MAASTALWSAGDVESFIYEYYDAWSGTDEDLILSYYADNVVLEIPGTLMEGKKALRDQFVRPFITAFPGNRHIVKNMIFGSGVVTVEFSFEAQHKGPFAGVHSRRRKCAPIDPGSLVVGGVGVLSAR